jgi:hypothetical protein
LLNGQRQRSRRIKCWCYSRSHSGCRSGCRCSCRCI